MFLFISNSYFEVSSTQEMLNEWKPLLCPFDTAMIDAMDFFSLFLPTLTFPEQFEQTHELWFNELLHLWLELRNNSQIDEVREWKIKALVYSLSLTHSLTHSLSLSLSLSLSPLSALYKTVC